MASCGCSFCRRTSVLRHWLTGTLWLVDLDTQVLGRFRFVELFGTPEQPS
jgi:hypothetical protein